MKWPAFISGLVLSIALGGCGGAATVAPASSAPAASGAPAASSAAKASAGAPATSAAGKAGSSTPGVTDTEVVLGANAPITSPANYLVITNTAARAYFDEINAQGGVNGRQIKYVVKDDGYDPGKTPQVIRELVESDKVFAIFNGIGTATSLAALPYLTENKVPDLFIGSGSVTFGGDPKKYPTAFGWQINNTSEGKIDGNYIAKTWPGKKVGIFYQNDDYGQHLAQGIEDGIGKANPIVGKQPYESTSTSVTTQISALKSAGAEIIATASITPFTVMAIKAADGMDYHPQYTVGWATADPSFFKLVGDPKLADGMIVPEFMPLFTDTSNPQVAKLKAIWDKRGDGKPFSLLAMYGMGEAQTMVKALQLAGKDLTRPGIIKAVESINNFTDSIIFVPINYSATDHFGITSAQMVKASNGKFEYFGPTYTAPLQGAVTQKGS